MQDCLHDAQKQVVNGLLVNSYVVITKDLSEVAVVESQHSMAIFSTLQSCNTYEGLLFSVYE